MKYFNKILIVAITLTLLFSKNAMAHDESSNTRNSVMNTTMQSFAPPQGVYESLNYADQDKLNSVFSKNLTLCSSDSFMKFEDISTKVLTEKIEPCVFFHFSQYGLKLLRNSIYARYGMEFKSSDLDNFFKSQIWYKRNKNFNTNFLTDIQKRNIEIIKIVETLKATEGPGESQAESGFEFQNKNFPRLETFLERLDESRIDKESFFVDDKGFLVFNKSSKKIDLKEEKPPEEPDIRGYFIRGKRTWSTLKDRVLIFSPEHYSGGPGDYSRCSASMYAFSGDYLGSLGFCPAYRLKQNSDLLIGIHNYGCCGESDININFFDMQSLREILLHPNYSDLVTYISDSDLFVFSTTGYVTSHGERPDPLISLGLFDSKLNVKASGSIKDISRNEYQETYTPYCHPLNLVSIKELIKDKAWGLKYTSDKKNYYMILSSNGLQGSLWGFKIEDHDSKTFTRIGDIRYREIIKTPLINAVIANDLNEVKLLLTKEENVNQQLEDGTTALMEAAKKGRVEIADYLIKSGADLNYKMENTSETALDLAIRYNQPEMAELLFKRGIKYAIESEQMKTSLARAIIKNRLKIVEVLLNHGAEVQNGYLSLAMVYESYDVAKLLYARGAKLILPDNELNQLLMQAASKADMAVLNILFESGAKPNETIFLQSIEKNPELALALIKKGVAINKPAGYDSRTPLMQAAAFGRIDLIKRMLKRGADVNAKDRYGETPLVFAARNGDLKIFKLLTDAGGDINAEYKPGECSESVLSNALLKKRYEIIQYMLAKKVKADYKILNCNKTPLEWAIQAHDSKIVKMLIDGGVDIEKEINSTYHGSPLTLAVSSNDLECVRLLLEAGANLSIKYDGHNALQIAAEKGNLEILKLLHEKFGQIDKNYALSLAAGEGHLSVVKFLIENNKGLDINRAINSATNRGHPEIVKYFSSLVNN